MTMQITLRKGYFLPLCCQSPPYLGIEVLWGSGTTRASRPSPRGEAQKGEIGGPPRCHQLSRGEDLDTSSSICLSPECPAAGCAWLHAYVGACSPQDALAASMLFQANGRTLRWNTLGPIIGGSISLMVRETASLAPFHWSRPTEGSLDSQPMLSHKPTEVCSAAGSCFPLRLMGSPVSGAALSPHCHPWLKTLAMKHRRHEQWDLIKAARWEVGWGPGAMPRPIPCKWVQVKRENKKKGENKQVELVGVGTVGLTLRANPDGWKLLLLPSHKPWVSKSLVQNPTVPSLFFSCSPNHSQGRVPSKRVREVCWREYAGSQ